MNVMLQWKNVLLETIGIEVNVFTSSYDDRYSAIMIFDKDGRDLLADDSEFKNVLADYLVEAINNYSVHGSKSNFSDLSWKEINPISYKKYHPNSN